MSIGLANEIIREWINYSEDDLLACRLVCRTWKGYADELCYKKFKAFPIDVAPHEAPLLYLKLKHFVPQLFQVLAQTELPLPECLPLVILRQGIQKESFEVEDLLQLNKFRKCGQLALNRPVREAPAERKKMTLTAVVLVQKLEELANPKDSNIVKIVCAILLNKYAKLSHAVSLKNEISARFFLERASHIKVKCLQDDFKKAQSTDFSLSKRIFEAMVVKDPLFTTSEEFNHTLGHMAAQVKWVKSCLLVAEEKRNSLFYGQTQEITVEDANVAHFETSTLSLGVNALHEAVCFDSTDRVIELLDNGMPVNGCDFASRTPLMVAARKGSSAVFTLLLKRGARILQKDMWGLTAMDWCAIQGKHDMLITSHAYANQTPEYHHALFLYKARSIKYVEVVDPIQQIIDRFVNLQLF